MIIDMVRYLQSHYFQYHSSAAGKADIVFYLLDSGRMLLTFQHTPSVEESTAAAGTRGDIYPHETVRCVTSQAYSWSTDSYLACLVAVH